MSFLHPAELRADLSYCCSSIIIVQERDLKFGLKIGDIGTEAFNHDVEKGSFFFTREGWHHCGYVLVMYPLGEVGENLQMFISEGGVAKNLNLVRHD